MTSPKLCDPILVKIVQRSRSHGHIMYKAKKHHNSSLGCPINFILGGWHNGHPQIVEHNLVATSYLGVNMWANAQLFWYKMFAMSTPVA